jgi:hypothetical protein
MIEFFLRRRQGHHVSAFLLIQGDIDDQESSQSYRLAKEILHLCGFAENQGLGSFSDQNNLTFILSPAKFCEIVKK